jgi:serine/threonine protein kinase
MTLEFGTLLNNRYRIVGILGQGGMGSVYRAHDENLGVDVAVKENLFLSDEYAKQFRIEAKILASLRHPNLPRVGDHFVIRGQGQYLVMDFIEGEDLRQRMERTGILPEAEVIEIGIQICDALTYLHTRQPPIIHRDVKPGNVKITPDGEYVLVDFGLAKIMLDAQSTTTGARAMTPGFSPPEQYGTARTDARTDIYSLGATLYVALTAHLPEEALARATGNATLTGVRTYNPDVSIRMAVAIEKAMALQPDERWQTAEEFKIALEDARDNSAVPEQPVYPGLLAVGSPYNRDSTPIPISSFLQREPSALEARKVRRSAFPWGWFIFIVLLAVGVIGVIILRPELVQGAQLRTSTPTPTLFVPTSTETPTLTPSATITITSSATPEPTGTATPVPSPTITPTLAPTLFGGGGSQIAFVSERSGKPQVWLMNADGSNQHILTQQKDGACQPDWSPDGQQIVFISPCLGRGRLYQGSSLYLINIDGTDLTPLPTAPEGDFDPNWSPDGQSIVFTSLRNGRPQIYLIQLADKSFTNLSNTELNDWQPTWSPDGKTIAFVRDRFTHQIWLMDADGRNQRQFSRSINLDDGSPTWSPDGEIIFFTQVVRDTFTPWLMGMRLRDINALNKEFQIPPNWTRSSGYISSPQVSADGFWIVFEDWLLSENARNIYIMTTNGGEFKQLTTDKAHDYQPAWQRSLTVP